MKKIIALLFVVIAIVACNNSTTDATGANGIANSGQPLAYDACSCAGYSDSRTPEYAKCKELRKADAQFEKDFQQCFLAQKSGMDTNQVKLKKEGEMKNVPVNMSGTFNFDVQNSAVTWRGEKANGKSHKGSIQISSGSFNFENGNILSGEIKMDMSTIKVVGEDAGSASKLETHLKSDDFFSVVKHPSAKFEVKHSAQQSAQTFAVTGMLTIKGISNEVTANLVVAPNMQNAVIGGSMVFNRALFEVRYGSDKFFDNLGDNLIKNDVLLTFDLKANK